MKLNRKINLEVSYTYRSSDVVYWLFILYGSEEVVNPARNFIYPQGKPRGTSGNKLMECLLLRDGRGQLVPCLWASQNSKPSPYHDLIHKTLTSLQQQRCRAPRHDPTTYFSDKAVGQEEKLAQQDRERRGHAARETCERRLIFEYCS